MSETVFVAVLSLIGTCAGALGGVLTANRLVNYRIEQLEKKVEKHNSIVERLVLVERAADDCRERVESIEKRILG